MEPFARMEMLSSPAGREPFDEDRSRPEEVEGLGVSDVKDVASKAGSGAKTAAKATGSGLKKATSWVGNILGKFGKYIKWACCIVIVLCIGFIISKLVQLAKNAGAVATGIGGAVGAVSAVAAGAVAAASARNRKLTDERPAAPPPPPDLLTTTGSEDVSTGPTGQAVSFEANANANAVAPGKDMLAADMVSDAVAANNALVTDALAANNRLVTAALPQPELPTDALANAPANAPANALPATTSAAG